MCLKLERCALLSWQIQEDFLYVVEKRNSSSIVVISFRGAKTWNEHILLCVKQTPFVSHILQARRNEINIGGLKRGASEAS